MGALKNPDIILLGAAVFLVADTALNLYGTSPASSADTLLAAVASGVTACLAAYASCRARTQPAIPAAGRVVAALSILALVDLLLGLSVGNLFRYTFFAMIPVLAWRLAKAWVPSFRYTFACAATGIVVAPVGRGLFSLALASPGDAPQALAFLFTVVCQFLALVGYVLSSVHEFPAYRITAFLAPAGDGRGEGYYFFHVVPVAAVLWGLVYGCAGRAIDWLRGAEPASGS